LDAVTDHALRKAPDERYASCKELTQDLRAALAGPRSLGPLADFLGTTHRKLETEEHGQVVYGSLVDISERRRSEEADRNVCS
jgi:hypothetical protein